MKKLLWAAVVAALSSLAAQAQTYSNAVMALNPVSYWPLNETAAPVAAYIATNHGTLGAVANGYYGTPYPDDLGSPPYTLFTGPVTGVTSDGDAAAAFPGTGSAGDPSAYVTIPHISQGLTTSAPFTAEVWVQPGGGDPNDVTGSSYASTEWTSIVKEGYGGNGWGDGYNANGNSAGWSVALAGIYCLGQPVGWYLPGPNAPEPVQYITNAMWVVDFYSGNSGAPTLEMNVPMYEPSPAWFHLVLSYDGTNANFYTNGVLAATTLTNLPQNTNLVWSPGNYPESTPGGNFVFTPSSGVNYTADDVNPVVFGNINVSGNIYDAGYPSSSSGTIGFNNQIYQGAMDEAAIYTNALSGAAVAKHYTDASASDKTAYTNDVLSAHPIVYLRFDEPAYTPAQSSFGFPPANNYGSYSVPIGLYQPGTIPGVPGAPLTGFGSNNFAVQFNGLDAGVDVGQQGLAGSPLDPVGNVPYSLVYWFKGNPADSYARFQGTIGRGDSDWRSSMDGSGKVRWNPGQGPEISSANNYNDGAWHMFAGVTDGTNDYLYIDGQLSASGNGVGAVSSQPLDIMIGGAPDYTVTKPNGSSERYFAGELAQAAFFTNALSLGQVETLYESADVPPAITTNPPAVTGVIGNTSFTLTANALGTPPLSFQWYQNTNELSNGGAYAGVTNTVLSITDAQTLQSGTYTLVVTNSYGSVTSAPAVVTVSFTPGIITEPTPASTTVYSRNAVSYSVGAVGVAPLSYQWYNGTTPINGAVTSNLTVAAESGTNNYSVIVINTSGSQTSSVVSVVGVPFVPPATGFAVNLNDDGIGAYQGMGVYQDAPANTNWNVWLAPPGGTTNNVIASSGVSTLVGFNINYGFNNGANNAGYQGSPCFLVEYEAGVNSGSPGAGTSANPMGTFQFNDVPQGIYNLYVYSANYDGNRGSIISVGPLNGGVADQGIDTTTNVQSDHTCDTMVEGDNYVYFHHVVPDPTGTISGSYVPNPNGTLTGEGQIDAVQLVMGIANIQLAPAGNVTVTWTGGVLESATDIQGPWTPVTGSSPLTIPLSPTNTFYQVY